jgi:hypothetical protein
VSPSKFDDAVKKAPQGRTFGSIRLLMIMGDKTFRAVATHNDHIKAFIKAYISANYNGGVMPFVSGGFEPEGKNKIPNRRYVFPLESEYLGMLAQYERRDVHGRGGADLDGRAHGNSTGRSSTPMDRHSGPDEGIDPVAPGTGYVTLPIWQPHRLRRHVDRNSDIVGIRQPRS